VPVEHEGNATDSDEEAAAVAELVRDLLADGATWTDRHGDEHPLGLGDVVIVAPYNAHVAAIERAFAAAAMKDPFVGTVDMFQGQERPVSIYAMGTSAPEDAPRGMEFLYSLNRLNVATSRARCVAAVVCSPALLRVGCRTPRQMQLANGLCLAVEAAAAAETAPGAAVGDPTAGARGRTA
jgi:superfamily I DNA and/or RNA helicase